MALKISQQLKLSQQLVMTPQLQMAIKLLQLSRLELMDVIRQEMLENPALEESLDTSVSAVFPEEDPPEAEKAPEAKEVTIEERIPEDIDWSNYIEEYNTPGQIFFEGEKKEEINLEAFTPQKTSLKDHLLWQLLMTAPSPEDEKIGSLIIGNLNRDGYLDVSVEDLAAMSGAPSQAVQRVLSRMQSFDPAGVCARDLQECLLIQASQLELDNTIVPAIIREHLALLENRNYKAIAKALKVDPEEVLSAVKIIQGLEPKPGRKFSEEEVRYIIPDIYVYKMDDEFIIVLNDDGLPRLRINSFYRNALSKGEPIGEKEREYIQEKIRSATWLIRSIHQRHKTIYRVMKSILGFQREFFEKGITHLKPMVLRDVAQDIGMHESTISRVTTNKYAYTPQGLFELKFFFNSPIHRFDGEALASASVQEKIRQIIENESPKKPLSDSKIVEILKGENINIARRTVAKYREMMKILPSNMRKQL